jgi:hypothetical protein
MSRVSLLIRAAESRRMRASHRRINALRRTSRSDAWRWPQGAFQFCNERGRFAMVRAHRWRDARSVQDD